LNLSRKTQCPTLDPGNGAQKLIGPQAHGGVVAIKVDPTETRLIYWVIISQDRLSEPKSKIEMLIINYLM